MKLIQALLPYTVPWALPDVYLFTGNAMVRNDGACVMGRGAAKVVRDRWPGVDFALGYMINESKQSLHWVRINDNQHIGWFKVKEHWANDADPDLIRASVTALTKIALGRPAIIFHMNYPGVGNGRLDQTVVEPLLSSLPDNVVIYR